MNIPIDLTISASLLFSMLAMIVAVMRTRRRDLDDQLKDIGERLTSGTRRMDNHSGRLDQMQNRLEMMPGKEDVHQLELAVTEVVGQLKVMGARMESNHEMLTRVDNILSRHEDHLRGDNG